jgi:hypothetical protein
VKSDNSKRKSVVTEQLINASEWFIYAKDGRIIDEIDIGLYGPNAGNAQKSMVQLKAFLATAHIHFSLKNIEILTLNSVQTKETFIVWHNLVSEVGKKITFVLWWNSGVNCEERGREVAYINVGQRTVLVCEDACYFDRAGMLVR